jgi:hypothetical protein
MTPADVIRTDPPRLGDERPMLDTWLDYYRAALLAKCSDLTGEQLAERTCPPSPMSLIGLVRHMTEMERAYVHQLADPQLPLRYCTDDRPDGDFDDVSPTGAVADLETFTAHCRRSRQVLGGLALDDEFGDTRPFTVRWIYLYLIKEYARHLGHTDLLRERLDGATGE